MTNQLWDKIALFCRRTQRIKGDITNTICCWPQEPFQSCLLNALWSLLPGLILWTIWKERNKRIFKDQSTPIDIIWIKFCRNLQETIALHPWQDSDFLSSPNEESIWNNWNLSISPPTVPPSAHSIHPDSAHNWSPSSHITFKLNFYGASKGNLGLAGFGGILRNSDGNILQIYYGSIGINSNNSEELEGLWQGLLIAEEVNLSPLEVEGDSQIPMEASS